MSESELVALVQAASLEIPASVTETMRHAGARDNRFGRDLVGRTARLAVAAWAKAVGGDDTALAEIGQPEAVHRLMYPVGKPWQVAPGPRVTKIEIEALEADAEPPRLRLMFHFVGRKRLDDPGQADGAADSEMPFVGLLDLTLSTGRPWPWQLSSGHVEVLDDFLGYVFTSRRETPQEYQQRTGSTAGVAADGTARRVRLVAGFAEHDERFGSSVEIEVQRQTVPTRDEAEQLVWPAIAEKITAALGEGDWRPSLNWLDVVELRGDGC